MAYLLILSLLSLCVIWSPATANQGDGGVDKMEDRFRTMERKINQYMEENGRLKTMEKKLYQYMEKLDRLKTMERKLNQYMDEHGHLLQQNQELQRRVSETEKKNEELMTKIGTLKETVKKIQQSNAKCQMDVKQLSKFFGEHSYSFTENSQKLNETTKLDSDGLLSISTSNPIHKRIATVAPADQVAFFTYLSASTAANLPSKHILVFDHVVLNKGQGYHQDDGIFIVPSHGVYVFAWTVGVQYHGWTPLEIVVNGVVFGSTFVNGGADDWDFSTGIVVVEIHTGDHVYIRMAETGRELVHSNWRGRTSFSGWKLF